MSLDPQSVAALFTLSDVASNAARWAHTSVGRQISAAWDHALTEAAHVSGDVHEPDLFAFRNFVIAHGLSPEFLLGLPAGAGWRAAFSSLAASEQQAGADGFVESARSGLLDRIVALWLTTRLPHSGPAQWITSLTGAELERLLTGEQRLDALARPIRLSTHNAPQLRQAEGAAMNNLPHAPDPIVGRDSEIRGITEFFGGRHREPAVVLVHGLSGVGKSRLAMGHAAGQLFNYDLVWWVPSQAANIGLPPALLDLARRLGVPRVYRDEPDVVLDRLTRQLSQLNAQYLFILDDLISGTRTATTLASRGAGHLLITSQSHAHRCDRAIPLSGLSGESADAYYSDLLGEVRHLPDSAPRLPDGSIRPIDVQDSYRAAAARTSPPARGGPASTEDDVLRTLRVVDERAAVVVQMCALLGRGPIPVTTLGASRSLAQALGIPTGTAGDHLAKVAVRLREFSLITAPTDSGFELHDITRKRVRDNLPGDVAHRLSEVLVIALDEVLERAVRARDRASQAEMAPHCRAVLNDAIRSGPLSEHCALMAVKIGTYWNAIADRQSALPVLLAAAEALDSATIVGYQCRLELARAQRHVADLRSAYFGYLGLLTQLLPADLDPGARVSAVAGMCRLLLDLGRPRTAARICHAEIRRTRSIRVADTLLLRSMYGRAELQLRRRGARATFRDAADLGRRELGSDSAEYGWALDDLGAVLIVQGEPHRAVEHLTAALAIETTRSGIDHPRRAWTLLNLATAYHGAGDLASTGDLIASGHALQQASVPAGNPDLRRFAEFDVAWQGGKPLPLQAIRMGAANGSWTPARLRGLPWRTSTRLARVHP